MSTDEDDIGIGAADSRKEGEGLSRRGGGQRTRAQPPLGDKSVFSMFTEDANKVSIY